MADGLDAAQLDRYARQVVLREVGADGQSALLDASVLVVGAGGLGTPVVQYLAGAGVGHLTVADGDTVERSNLHRQTLYRESDVGDPKAEVAARFVRERTPDVTVATRGAVGPDEAPDLVADHDVVVDCSDNFPTRFLLNDACVLEATPLVHGAVYRFEGQATAVAAGGRPCYRCPFPEAPEPGTVPNCAEVGVLGAVPGVVGAVQATEALKTALGVGESLAGRLFVFDLLGADVETVPVAPRPDCPVCGEGGLDDVGAVTYEGRCAVPEG